MIGSFRAFRAERLAHDLCLSRQPEDLTIGPTRVIFLTSGTTWTVPADWNNNSNTIDTIGGGAGGAGGASASYGSTGGGGGAWSQISNLALTPGASVTFQIGAPGTAGAVNTAGGDGGDTWFNGASLAASSVGAKGGKGGAVGSAGASGGAGGAKASGVGTVKNSGGRGGNVTNQNGSSGGGGAAGPHGDGAAGGDCSTVGTTAGTGGGGADGGAAGGSASSGTAGAGGNNRNGTGGGAVHTSGTQGGGGGGSNAAGSPAGAGSYESVWVQTSDGATAGPGSGGGGGFGDNISAGNAGGVGGGYGGGGGAGGGSTAGSHAGAAGTQGLIVITYTLPTYPTGRLLPVGSFRSFRAPQLAIDWCPTRTAEVVGSGSPTIFYPRLEQTPSNLTLPSDYFNGAVTQKNAADAGANARVMDLVPGSAQQGVSPTWSSVAASGVGVLGVAQFCSPPLAAGSYPAGNWSFGMGDQVTNASSTKTWQYGHSLYLVNGATGAVKTTIWSSIVGATSSLTSERTSWSNAVAGAAFAPASGDYLVFEFALVFNNNTAGAVTPATTTFTSGTTAITSDGAATSSAKSFLQAPWAIALQPETNPHFVAGVFRPFVAPRAAAHAVLAQATEHDASGPLPTQPDPNIHAIVGRFAPAVPPRYAHALLWQATEHDASGPLPAQPDTFPAAIVGAFRPFAVPRAAQQLALCNPAEDVPPPVQPETNPHVVAGRFVPFAPPRESIQVYQQATEHDQTTLAAQPETNVHQIVGSFRGYTTPRVAVVQAHADIEPPAAETNPHFVAGAFRAFAAPRATVQAYQQNTEHDQGTLAAQPETNVHQVVGAFHPFALAPGQRVIVTAHETGTPQQEMPVHQVAGRFAAWRATTQTVGLLQAPVEDASGPVGAQADPNVHATVGRFAAFVMPRAALGLYEQATEHDRSGAAGAQPDPNVHFVAGSFRGYAVARAAVVATLANPDAAEPPVAETNVHQVVGRFTPAIPPRAAFVGLHQLPPEDITTLPTQPETNPHFVAGSFRGYVAPRSTIIQAHTDAGVPQAETNPGIVAGRFAAFRPASGAVAAALASSAADVPAVVSFETNVHAVVGSFRAYVAPRASAQGYQMATEHDAGSQGVQPETNPHHVAGAFHSYTTPRAAVEATWGNAGTDTGVPQAETNPHAVVGRFAAWHVPPGAVVFPATADVPPAPPQVNPSAVVGRFVPCRTPAERSWFWIEFSRDWSSAPVFVPGGTLIWHAPPRPRSWPAPARGRLWEADARPRSWAAPARPRSFVAPARPRTWVSQGEHMPAEQLQKLPDEGELFTIDFSQRAQIDAGRTITGTPSLTVVAPAGDTSLTISGIVVSGGQVQARISGGNAGVGYKLKCLATLDDGEVIGVICPLYLEANT